jgi:hypothetical protein
MDPKKLFDGIVYFGSAYLLAHEAPKYIKADAAVVGQVIEDHLTPNTPRHQAKAQGAHQTWAPSF